MDDIICKIEWKREDIAKVLSDVGKPTSNKDIDTFINEFDWKYFKEKSIQEGFEILSSSINN